MFSKNLIGSKNQAKQAPMFEKRTVVELSENEMANVEGGSTPFCYGVIVGLALAIKLM